MTKRTFKRLRCDKCNDVVALIEGNFKTTKNRTLILCTSCFDHGGFTSSYCEIE